MNTLCTIAVKLCGHCSPQLDLTEITKRLKARNLRFRFQYFSDGALANVLLVLHACPAACAQIPKFPGKVIACSVPRGDGSLEEQEQRFLQTVERALMKGATMSQKTAFAEVQSITFGADKITAIPDGGAYIKATTMYPPSAADNWAAHEDLTDQEQRVIVTLGGFLIETGDRKILMDLGYGPQTVDFPGFGPFIGGGYLENLKKAGVTPEEITDVLYTHLHCDHVGWTSVEENGKRVLTFPNAAYWCSRPEWEFWVQNPGGLGPDQAAVLDPLKDVIGFVEDGGELAPRLTAHLAPGHTPGMTILRLSNGAQTLWFSADIFHSTVQFLERDWYAVFDVDHELGARTRTKYLPEFVKEGTILADCHFSNIVFGKLRDIDGCLHWEPVVQ